MKIDKQCEDCGALITIRVAIDGNGKEIKPYAVCQACEDKRRRQREYERRCVKAEQLSKQQRERWLETIPAGFRDKIFENFDRSLQPKAFEAISKFDPSAGKSLILASPDLYGMGKTHLVCALAQKIYSSIKDPVVVSPDDMGIRFRPKPVEVVIETKMLSRIRQTFNHKEDDETEDQVYLTYERCPLLIIDDVGKVRPRELNFLQSVYFEIIDSRYNEQKPMILTTNLNQDELENHIGGACADRLREMCGKKGFITMVGTSYRRRS